MESGSKVHIKKIDRVIDFSFSSQFLENQKKIRYLFEIYSERPNLLSWPKNEKRLRRKESTFQKTLHFIEKVPFFGIKK